MRQPRCCSPGPLAHKIRVRVSAVGAQGVVGAVVELGHVLGGGVLVEEAGDDVGAAACPEGLDAGDGEGTLERAGGTGLEGRVGEGQVKAVELPPALALPAAQVGRRARVVAGVAKRLWRHVLVDVEGGVDGVAGRGRPRAEIIVVGGHAALGVAGRAHRVKARE